MHCKHQKTVKVDVESLADAEIFVSLSSRGGPPLHFPDSARCYIHVLSCASMTFLGLSHNNLHGENNKCAHSKQQRGGYYPRVVVVVQKQRILS